jgi:gas vesicle protein
MFFRRGKSRVQQAKEAVAERLPDREQARDQVADLTGEVADALEAAQSAITRLAASAGRKGASTTRKARKQSAKLAETVSERLPDPDQVVDAYRKVTDKLFPERVKQRRKQARKRRRGLLYRGAGIAGLGLLAGWLTAPKRGAEARRAVKQQVARAGAKGMATAGAGEEAGSADGTEAPPSPAQVTQLNRGEGVNQSSRS